MLEPELRAVSILTGETNIVGQEELGLLLSLPVDEWVDCDAELLDALVEKGLAVVEGEATAATDERLAATEWNLYGALYHSRTRWRGVTVPLETPPEVAEAFSETALREFVEHHGDPPPHFHTVPGAVGEHELPVLEPQTEFFRLLGERRTSRAFDTSRRLREDELAVLLRAVFGAQGLSWVAGEWAGVRRTSPSGGGLHPVEAYPLVLDVEGVAPGLYHYHSGRHTLALLEPLERTAARDLAVAFTCGQGYFGDAGLLVVLAARFERSFWKYRRHEKAYAVTLMDAGHLSQTFYLVCAELGLGAFVTAAVNNADIDERLGLDGFAEGSLAIVGCGRLLEERSPLHPAFEPYRPPR